MGTLVLDFDSTLVPCESLEVVLSHAGPLSSEQMAEIEHITRLGMEGRLAFRPSLERRLAVASPRRADVLAVADDLVTRVTPGSLDVVRSTRARGHAVAIVSGAFRDAVLPVAASLGVDARDVHAVRPLWDADGGFAGLAEDDPFTTSKVAGVGAIEPPLQRPIVVVGDGATDADLRDRGLADVFVAFTQHVRREAVVARADVEVEKMAALGALLDTLWG